MADELNDALILEGAVGIYRRVDLERGWGDVSILIPFGSDLNSLGFKLIGDLVCSAMAHGILRAYVQPTEGVDAVLLVGMKEGRVSVFGLFFSTLFADGATLTTTTSVAVKDAPEKGMHQRVYAWQGVPDLYRKHQLHINELKATHGDVQPACDTLLSLAQSIDSISVRKSQ